MGPGHERRLEDTNSRQGLVLIEMSTIDPATTRRVAELLREAGKRVAVLRHPMPYGDLAKQAVERFARRVLDRLGGRR